MGMIVEFPADAMRRRAPVVADSFRGGAPATVTILPVVRIERHTDDVTNGGGTEEGAPSGRGRKRRVRS